MLHVDPDSTLPQPYPIPNAKLNPLGGSRSSGRDTLLMTERVAESTGSVKARLSNKTALLHVFFKGALQLGPLRKEREAASTCCESYDIPKHRNASTVASDTSTAVPGTVIRTACVSSLRCGCATFGPVPQHRTEPNRTGP